MITRGIGAVARGMQAMLDFEDVTAHNLANVTTTGFKRSNITFQDILESKVKAQDSKGSIGSLSIGSRADRTYIDFSQGGLSESGNKLDVAFQGDGFFKIRHRYIDDKTPYSENNYYYQRVGNFILDKENYLINREGDWVMDTQNKRIKIARDPESEDPFDMNNIDVQKNLIIDENGQIEIIDTDSRVMLQKLQVCDFEDKTKISAIGEGKYLPIYGQNAGLHIKQDGTYSLQQGYIEASNANTIKEMLNSINVSRGYESMSNILKTQSDSLQQAINLANINR